jgi:hypothetical protein
MPNFRTLEADNVIRIECLTCIDVPVDTCPARKRTSICKLGNIKASVLVCCRIQDSYNRIP